MRWNKRWRRLFIALAAGMLVWDATNLAEAHADPYCPGCASPTPGYDQPNQLYPPYGGPPVQWQGPQGQGGCFNYGNTGVHCS